MDIVLNTTFDNPNLPIIPMPGFTDSFNRGAADTMGTTNDGKPWRTFDSGATTSTWGTYGDGTAGMKSSTSQYHMAVVDSLASNGTLTAKISGVESATRRPGLVVRAKDEDNFVSIAQASSSVHELRLAKRVAGSTTTFPGTGPALATGDVITVELDGPTVTVKVNGAEALSASIPENADATQHGLYAFQGATGVWDSAAFTV